MANSHRAPKELAELRGDLSALKLKIVLLEKQEAELGRIEFRRSLADACKKQRTKNASIYRSKLPKR